MPINTSTLGYHPQYEPYIAAEQSLTSFRGGVQGLTSTEAQSSQYFLQSGPSLIQWQNVGNQLQGFGRPFNVAPVSYKPQDNPSGFLVQSLAPPTHEDPGVIKPFETPPVNYHVPSEPPMVAEQTFAVSSTHINVDAESTTKARHMCNWLACDRSFSRTADRDRHVRTKHSKARTYHCREPGCKKGAGYWKGYSRIDKLQDHMRKKHLGVAFRGTM